MSLAILLTAAWAGSLYFQMRLRVRGLTGVLPLYFVQVLCRNLLDNTIRHLLPY
jgi:hypothetical protein